jgi:hypothetical protein
MIRRDHIVAILVIGASLGAGVFARSHFRNGSASFRAYTIVWQAIRYDANGAATFEYTETRYKASDGRWYDVRQFPNGQKEESFAEPGRGVFAIRKDKLAFLSVARTAPPMVLSEEQWPSTPQFARVEIVGGLKVVVLKTNDHDPFVENYVAPELNGDSIKRVFRTSTSTTVLEPLSIKLDEPDPAVFKNPQLPVDYTNFDQIHGRENRP